jgi:hypothetical protein
MSSTGSTGGMARAVVKIAGGIVGFALLAGWSVQRDTPQGIALRATGDPCAPLAHGFAAMYSVVLGAATGVVVVVGLGMLIASNLGLLSQGHARLRELVKLCAVTVAVLLAAQLGHYVIKAVVAQAPAPPCVKVR